MPRPLRRLYASPASSRRRHRTWMLSMTLATGGAAVWAVCLLWRHVSPEDAPSLGAAWMLSGAFTAPGFLMAFLSLRARTAWLLFASVPLIANGMMLFLPWVALRMR